MLVKHGSMSCPPAVGVMKGLPGEVIVSGFDELIGSSRRAWFSTADIGDRNRVETALCKRAVRCRITLRRVSVGA